MKKYLLVPLFLFFMLWHHSAAQANTCTFVADGTSRNWSAATSWTGCGSVAPTAADDVVFSTNVVSSTLVIDGTSGSPSLCKSIDTTNYTRTITMGGTAVLNVGGSTSGAFKMTAGMAFVPNGASVIKFVSTTTGNNITFGGYLFGAMTFDGVGGGWTFQDAATFGSFNPLTITLTNGALDTNSQSVAASTGIGFSSSNSNTRSLTLGTTTWKLGGNTGNSVWDISTSTGMSLSATSSTISASGSGVTSSFNGGGLTYGAVNFLSTTGSYTVTGVNTFGTLTSSALTTGTITFTSANTFGTLTTSMAGSTKTTTSGYVFPAGVTQTVTGTFTAAGSSLILRNFLYSSTLGTAATISAGTFAITNTDLRDITKAGSGSGNISATSATTGNGDCGGNTGWTFQAPRNVYMKTAVSVNWSAANWFTTSGGSTAAVPPLPLCHDTAIFDVNSVTATLKTITNDQPRIPSFTFSGVANTPAFATGSTQWEAYGSLILVSGMTHTGVGQVCLMGRGSFSFDGGSLTWPTSSTITLGTNNNTAGSTSSIYTLSQNLTSSSGLQVINNGTLALNGFNWSGSGGSLQMIGGTISGTGTLTVNTYSQTGGTAILGGTLTQTGAGALALSGGTLDMNSNQITGHTTATISSTGTLNLSGQMNGSGAISVTGGTINNTSTTATGELKGTTCSFSGGTSVVKKLTCSSTMAMSSTASLTFPVGGSATWATSWNNTGTTYSLKFGGVPSIVNGSLTVGGGNRPMGAN